MNTDIDDMLIFRTRRCRNIKRPITPRQSIGDLYQPAHGDIKELKLLQTFCGMRSSRKLTD